MSHKEKNHKEENLKNLKGKNPKRIVVGITGASGVIHGIRLLEVLNNSKVETLLIISDHAKQVMSEETEYKLEDVERLATRNFRNDDLGTPLSSGTYPWDAMIVVPCSTSSLAKIAVGISDNLITRAASVCLKEKRKLVLVPRESPLSSITLENMLKLSREGVSILPPIPGFYIRPASVEDIRDFVVGRILDQVGINHNLYRRWGHEYKR
jgi:4-hydroxy-3-polyprenylbenzoate decarboxylase